MSRNLTAANLIDLERSNFIVEDLIEFRIPGNNFWWTTGGSNINVTTPTSGAAVTFSVNNGVKVVGSLVESWLLTINEFTLQLETFDSGNTIVGGIDQGLSKCRLTVYKMFRDATTRTADTSNLLLIFDGYATAFNIEGGEAAQILQIQYRSLFNNFTGVKARTNSELEPPSGRQLKWGSIIWK